MALVDRVDRFHVEQVVVCVGAILLNVLKDSCSGEEIGNGS